MFQIANLCEKRQIYNEILDMPIDHRNLLSNINFL